MNVIQQAAFGFGILRFGRDVSGGWLWCMNPPLRTLSCKIHFSKLHFSCKDARLYIIVQLLARNTLEQWLNR